jgi:hypothetical protein
MNYTCKKFNSILFSHPCHGTVKTHQLSTPTIYHYSNKMFNRWGAFRVSSLDYVINYGFVKLYSEGLLTVKKRTSLLKIYNTEFSKVFSFVPENCCIEVEAEFADRTIETLDDIFATGLAFIRQAKFYVDA